MNKKKQAVLAMMLLGQVLAWGVDVPTPAPLPTWTKATVVEMIRLVLIEHAAEKEKRATKGESVAGRDKLSTGQKSRARILFDDQNNEAHLGERSKFVFDPEDHEFRVPDGLSLMTVSNGAVKCIGCTLRTEFGSTVFMESFTATNSAGRARCTTKLIVVEGHATVWAINKPTESKKLRGGQIIIYSDDDERLPDPEEIDIKRLVEESRLITGFEGRLPSMDKIQKVIDEQQRDLWARRLEPTRFSIGGRGMERHVDPLPGRTDLEAPFDPDVPGGIIIGNIPCALCP